MTRPERCQEVSAQTGKPCRRRPLREADPDGGWRCVAHTRSGAATQVYDDPEPDEDAQTLLSLTGRFAGELLAAVAERHEPPDSAG